MGGSVRNRSFVDKTVSDSFMLPGGRVWLRETTLWGAQMRSCSSLILVNQTAEQVTPAHPARAILVDGDQLSG